MRPLDPLEDAYAHGEAGFVRRPAPDRPRDTAASAFSRWTAYRRREWARGSQDRTRTAVLRRRTTDQRCTRGALQNERSRSRRHWHRVWRDRRSVRPTAWVGEARQMLYVVCQMSRDALSLVTAGQDAAWNRQSTSMRTAPYGIGTSFLRAQRTKGTVRWTVSQAGCASRRRRRSGWVVAVSPPASTLSHARTQEYLTAY